MTNPTRAPATAPGSALTSQPTSAPASTAAMTRASVRPAMHASTLVAGGLDRGILLRWPDDGELVQRLRLVLREELGSPRGPCSAASRSSSTAISPSPRTTSAAFLLRVDPDESGDLVDGGDIDLFEMRGRRMRGWLQVAPAAVADDEALAEWADSGRAVRPVASSQVLMTIDEVTELATRLAGVRDAPNGTPRPG